MKHTFANKTLLLVLENVSTLHIQMRSGNTEAFVKSCVVSQGSKKYRGPRKCGPDTNTERSEHITGLYYYYHLPCLLWGLVIISSA